jgi:hypothetical protein
VWGALATGMLGWTLVASGAGKLSAWGDFRSGLAKGGIVPRWLVLPIAGVVPPAECAAGVVVLVAPSPRPLAVAAVLYLLFALYQSELLQRGSPADCHCYGRLRHVPPGPGVAVANALLSFAGFALALGALSTGSLLPRLLWGAAAAAAYLLLAGRSRPRAMFSGYPYAELRYVERRLAGDSDLAAREAVAKEFNLGVHVTYLLVPRRKAWWLVVRARWRGTAAPIP